MEYSKFPKKKILALVIFGLLTAHFIWIASTWEGMGYTKDEGYYFTASKTNFGWYKHLVTSTLEGKPFEAFSEKSINRYWRDNHEHPPFCKTVQGLSHDVFHNWLPLLNYGNSHRMATWLWSALLLIFLTLLVTEWMGMKYAVFTIVLLFTLPRVFFHTHINTFDIPVVAMWFMTAYAFRKGMESHRWSWLAGALLGVGLATKNNSYFLPFLFFFLYFYSNYRKEFCRSVKDIPYGFRTARKWVLVLGLVLIIAPIAALIFFFEKLAMVIFLDLLLINILIFYHYFRRNPVIPRHLAPVFPAVFTSVFSFILLWPWIWTDTWPRLGEYFNRHINPPAWETYYLHNIVVNPPPFDWHYPFVMSWYTVPAMIIFVFLTGFVILLSKGRLADKFGLCNSSAEENQLLKRYEPRRQDLPIVTDGKWDQFFIIMNIVIPYLIIANPKTPIYGGTKHYMTAMPYVAIVCTICLKWIVDRLSLSLNLKGIQKTVMGFVLAVAIIVPGLLGIKHTHPYTLSYYNEIMGGSIAAPEVGMQRTFWAQSTTGILEHLNKVVPKNGSVFWNNTPWNSFMAYQKDGLLRKDIRQSRNDRSADFAVMNHWKFYTDGIYRIRDIYEAKWSETASHIDGMPLTEIIQNVKKHRLAHPELLDPSER